MFFLLGRLQTKRYFSSSEKRSKVGKHYKRLQEGITMQYFFAFFFFSRALFFLSFEKMETAFCLSCESGEKRRFLHNVIVAFALHKVTWGHGTHSLTLPSCATIIVVLPPASTECAKIREKIFARKEKKDKSNPINGEETSFKKTSFLSAVYLSLLSTILTKSTKIVFFSRVKHPHCHHHYHICYLSKTSLFPLKDE